MVSSSPSLQKYDILRTQGSMDCKVSAKGKTTHSSVPFLGDSAIDTLVDFVNQMKTSIKILKRRYKT